MLKTYIQFAEIKRSSVKAIRTFKTNKINYKNTTRSAKDPPKHTFN